MLMALFMFQEWWNSTQKKLSYKCVHNKMNHTQLLWSFQKGKDLKLEIEMACNHYTKFMV
jgi:hypothetical protein